MGKIIYTKSDEKGELNLVVGNVSSIREGNSGQLYISITVNEWDREKQESQKKYLAISAWDNTEKGGKNMVDRVRKAKLAAGSFASFLTGAIDSESNAEDGTPRIRASLIDFRYNHRWNFGEGDAERNIVIGTVTRTHDFDEDSFNVTIPVDNSIKKDDDNYDTAWYGITFKNTENRKNATNMRKFLSKGTACAVLCGSLRTSESNGYTNYNLYGFETVLAAKKTEETT